MSDLVSQLREHADSFNDDGFHDNPNSYPDLYREAADEIEQLRKIHQGMYRSQGGWIYQGDGTDHLESLTCPVVIQPEDLQKLVDCERGMNALRQVCHKHDGPPPEEQSPSAEDIALWADATISALKLNKRNSP